MNTKELISYIEAGNIDDKLQDIYIDRSNVPYQKERYINAITAFSELFNDADDIHIYSAPGRTEVGGNHTDHQHGKVLAASINNDAIAVACSNGSNEINIKSEGYDLISLNLDDLDKKVDEEGTTLSLIKGVAYRAKELGYNISGLNAYITSNVLGGSGLSSSAAFETLIGNILSGLFNNMKIDDITIAKIGQYAENVFFGKPCGLMDQMACSVGSLCYIDFLNPESPSIERIEADFDSAGYSLCITDTKGSHANLTPEYAAVPAEMTSVAAYFGKPVLRDVSEKEFLYAIPELRTGLSDRAVLRAMHFFEENNRVTIEANALKQKDFATFLTTVKASGDSSYKYLQNVYTTEDIEHQNISIALCISENVLGTDGGGARVHGGGFAGTIQAFVKNEKVQEYKKALDHVFGDDACTILKIRKYGGICII